MAKTKWDSFKFIEALRREAGRVFDSADFLSPIERDTFTRVFEMFAWIIVERQPQDNQLPALSDKDLQPLRDWMEKIGLERETFLTDRRIAHFVFPGFNERTASERTAEIISFPTSPKY